MHQPTNLIDLIFDLIFEDWPCRFNQGTLENSRHFSPINNRLSSFTFGPKSGPLGSTSYRDSDKILQTFSLSPHHDNNRKGYPSLRVKSQGHFSIHNARVWVLLWPNLLISEALQGLTGQSKRQARRKYASGTKINDSGIFDWQKDPENIPKWAVR